MNKKGINMEAVVKQSTDEEMLSADLNRTTTRSPIFYEQGRTSTENPFDRINSDNEKIIWILTQIWKQKSTSVEKSDLIDITQASELLKISKSTIYKLTANCEIPFIKREGTKKLIFSRDALDTWLKNSEAPKVNLVEKHLHMNLRVRKVQNN